MKKEITFVAGCAVNKDMYYIACIVDDYEKNSDVNHAVMCFYQDQRSEKWFHHELPGWRVVSTAFPDVPSGSVRFVYALEENGRVEKFSRDGSEFEYISGAGLDNSPYAGYVNRIRVVGSDLFVCGYNGQIYRRSVGQWISISQGLEREELHLEKVESVGAEEYLRRLENHNTNVLDIVDINGVSGEDMYAVGANGFMAHFDGGKWSPLKKITAANLNSILVLSKDDIVVVGRYGTILRGSFIDGFHVISRKNADFDLYGATIFQNQIYLASSKGLHILNDEIKPVDEDMLLGKNIQEVEAKDGVLWILSDKFLSQFDGKEFEYFFHPNNI